MDLFAAFFFVDLCDVSYCLLTSMELILLPNSRLLYLHSNDDFRKLS